MLEVKDELMSFAVSGRIKFPLRRFTLVAGFFHVKGSFHNSAKIVIQGLYFGFDSLRRYFRRKELSEALDIKKDAEELDAQDEEEDFSGSLCPNVRQRLWEMLEKPRSSVAARTFGTLSMAFVVVSIANMALISVELSWLAPPLLDALEYVCIVWFTAEFALRLLCTRDRWRFLRSVANIIDLLAILPFYITLLVESMCGGESSQELENVGRIVQVLRLLRALRMLKLGRHSTGTFSSWI